MLVWPSCAAQINLICISGKFKGDRHGQAHQRHPLAVTIAANIEYKVSTLSNAVPPLMPVYGLARSQSRDETGRELPQILGLGASNGSTFFERSVNFFRKTPFKCDGGD